MASLLRIKKPIKHGVTCKKKFLIVPRKCTGE